MLSLTPDEIVQAVRLSDTLEATSADGSFSLKVNLDHPYLCLAIHDGHRLREDLLDASALDAGERLHEEDPHTGELISGMANTMVGHDSRFEYDLNRDPTAAIYEEAWGKPVWKRRLSAKEKAESLAKHDAFYQVAEAVVGALVARHGGCVIYDIHSYNGLRKGGRAAPAFNVGTSSIDMRRFGRSVAFYERALAGIEIANEDIRVARDEVFQGRGYAAAWSRKTWKTVLCLPTEIRKFFCAEEGTPYPLVIEDLKRQLTDVMARHAAFFARSKLKQRSVKSHHILGGQDDKTVRKVDRALYRLAGRIETLLYVNPVNLAHEQKVFLAHPGRYEPVFRYRQLTVDPYLFREALYRLPVEDIGDPTLQQFYRTAVDGLAAKIDLLTTVGSREFLYNSLRYYGEPHIGDLKNAAFLLHAPESGADGLGNPAARLDSKAVVQAIQRAVDGYGIDAPVQGSSSLVAGAMVDNANFRVLVKKGVSLHRRSVDALINHEVGVHLLSSANARSQDLRIFRLGTPGVTLTQEGLAVYAEHLGGGLTVDRLKTLGARVMAVKSLLDNHTFSQTWALLVEEYGIRPEAAFVTTARVYRGGGFTKDYLYLRGLAQARAWHVSGKSWAPLFAGKVSFANADLVSSLIDRGIAKPPDDIARCFSKPGAIDPILEYLLNGLKFAHG